MATTKVQKNWALDADIADAFVEFHDRTLVGYSDAAQLGLYLLMQLTAQQREKLIAHMKARESVDLMGLFGEDCHSVSTDPTDPHTDPTRRTRDVLETPERPQAHGKRA